MNNFKIYNTSDTPINILEKKEFLYNKCEELQKQLPKCLFDYFIFLKGSVAVSTRLNYIREIIAFLKYCIEEDVFTEDLKFLIDIKDKHLNEITAKDINYYIGNHCSRYTITNNDNSIQTFYNSNKTLARKKTVLISLFKFLFRNEQIKKNITDGINPIKLPKKDPDSIKRLYIDEVKELLYALETGNGLTNKELDYWNKTKKRDYAIMMLFLTYGLRVSELQSLNISSFNYSRKEFIVFRKREKEIIMPLNDDVISALDEYIETERLVYSKKISLSKDALFLSLQGSRLDSKSIRNLVKKYTSIVMGTVREKGYSPHKLRATVASSLIDVGFSIYDVQNLLDHDNVTTTQFYASHKKSGKKETIERKYWE
ncbi:MAG: tyrosine-type recombinase/integrase [Filifactoraceae bacterium]